MLLVEVSKALPPKARTNPNYSEQTAPGCQVGQVAAAARLVRQVRLTPGG